MRTKISLVGGAYKHDALALSAQECVNLYPETAEDPNAKAPALLTTTPGFELVATPDTQGVCRGIYINPGSIVLSIHAIIGDDVYTYNEYNGTYSSKGTLNHIGYTQKVDWVWDAINSQTYICVNRVIHQLSAGTLTEITPSAATYFWNLAFQDGYGIADYANILYVSALGDLSSWTTTTYEQIQNPGSVVKILSHNGEVWILHDECYEIWYNSGETFPFNPRMGMVKNIGCDDGGSVAFDGESIYWFGHEKGGGFSIYKTRGYDAIRISTNVIEQDIKAYIPGIYATGETNISAYCYHEDGHSFYVISFKSAAYNKTWVYDSSTAAWHQRTQLNTTAGTQDPLPYVYHAAFNGNHYVADRNTGIIYKMTRSVYTDNSVAIIRTRALPTVIDMGREVCYGGFELDMEAGQGLATGQGSDPLISLQWSNDGGNTWSNKLYRSMGKIGQFAKRILWTRLGRGINRVFRIQTAEPIKMGFLTAYVEVEGEE